MILNPLMSDIYKVVICDQFLLCLRNSIGIFALVNISFFTCNSFVDTCKKHPVFKHLIEECNGPYSMHYQETGKYNVGWKPFNETANKINRRGKRKTLYKGYEDPWQFSSKFYSALNCMFLKCFYLIHE